MANFPQSFEPVNSDSILEQFLQLKGNVNKVNESMVEVEQTADSAFKKASDNEASIQVLENDVQTLNEKTLNFSNSNLLINGDFRVNQRNQELYTATGKSWVYTADRWRMYNLNNTFNATTKTIRLKGTTTFEQILEDYNSLAGKTVTLSANIKSFNGNAFKLFIEKGGVGEVVGNVISSTGIVSFTTTINENITSLRVGIKNTSSDTATFNEIVVDYFKLEIGSVATAYNPIPYAEELAMCQRYYEKIDTLNIANKNIIRKNARSTYFFYDGQVIFKVGKRTIPTVKVFSSNTDTEGYLYDNTSNADKKMILSYLTTDNFFVSIQNGDVAVNNVCIGYFEADAEIY